MAELGEESLEEHKAIVEEINHHRWKQVVLVGGDFLKFEHPFLTFENSVQATEWFKQQKYSDSHILIKGSRSMKMEKILEP